MSATRSKHSPERCAIRPHLAKSLAEARQHISADDGDWILLDLMFSNLSNFGPGIRGGYVE